jgi:N-acetylmuramoyl-L-alanine amidase
MKESAGAKFVPTVTDTGFAIRWPDRKIIPPFAERRYDDPLVSSIRFAGDTATIEFRDRGLSARAYPLPSPDRLVIEIGRAAAVPAPLSSAPAPAPVPTPAWTVVIDAGHGGTETGAIGPGGLQEKDATLQIARRVAQALPHLVSCRVVLTRDSDSVISLDDRTSVANHEKADLFLSIHANSSRATGAHGSETYYLSLEASDKLAQEVAARENTLPAAPPAGPQPPGGARSPVLDFILWDLAQSAHIKDSSELADTIQKELNTISGTENRGIKQAPFRVLVGATMPAVLVETAFISNAEEEKKLSSPVFQQNVADGISRAIAGFFGRRKPSTIAKPLAPAGAPPSSATPYGPTVPPAATPRTP